MLDWLEKRKKPRAIVSDIDDTILKSFDQPIESACRFLSALDRTIEVHFVTSRPESSRANTEAFIEANRLPGIRNLHFCPNWKSSRDHKAQVITELAREFDVIASIGDADEDEWASREAGVVFIRVTDEHEKAWDEMAALVRLHALPK